MIEHLSLYINYISYIKLCTVIWCTQKYFGHAIKLKLNSHVDITPWFCLIHNHLVPNDKLGFMFGYLFPRVQSWWPELAADVNRGLLYPGKTPLRHKGTLPLPLLPRMVRIKLCQSGPVHFSASGTLQANWTWLLPAAPLP